MARNGGNFTRDPERGHGGITKSEENQKKVQKTPSEKNGVVGSSVPAAFAHRLTKSQITALDQNY